jgi:hypothetical protein
MVLFSVILILTGGVIGLPLLQKQQQEAYAFHKHKHRH